MPSAIFGKRPVIFIRRNFQRHDFLCSLPALPIQRRSSSSNSNSNLIIQRRTIFQRHADKPAKKRAVLTNAWSYNIIIPRATSRSFLIPEASSGENVPRVYRLYNPRSSISRSQAFNITTRRVGAKRNCVTIFDDNNNNNNIPKLCS